MPLTRPESTSADGAASLPGWVDLASLATLFVALLSLTWRRWPDPLVDFWRNLYIPWRLSEGALLSAEVADWYGPLPHLVTSVGFSLFGPGLDVLLALNVLVAIGCGLTLRAMMLHVGNRGSAWVGTAVFLLVFCFAQYTPLGNYNFLTPYASQATWGLLGVLLALEGAAAIATVDSPRGWWFAGAGVGLAWLSKAETLLAAVAVVVVLCALTRRLPGAKFWVALLAVLVPTWALLSLLGGWEYGLEVTHRAWLFALSSEVRGALGAIPFFASSLGTNAPLRNAGELASWGAVAVGVLALAVVAPRAAERRPLITAIVGLPALGALAAFTPWLYAGRVLVVTTLVALAVGARTLRQVRTRGLALTLFAVASLAMLSRMALNPRLFHYGFTMAVLSTVLLVHMLVFEAPRAWSPLRRSAGAVSLVFAIFVLVAAGRLANHSLTIINAKSLPVGEGRDLIYANAPEHHRNGAIVRDLLSAIEAYAPGAKSLVVFPDGAAVSYLSRRPSPIPEFEFNPTSLAFAGGPAVVLHRLEQSPPDLVGFTTYDLSGHGAARFGDSETSGAGFVRFVQQHYQRLAHGPAAAQSPTGHAWDLFVRRAARDDSATNEAPP